MDFFVNIFMWFIFVYGLIEFFKNIIYFFYSKNKINNNGISVIIAVKNGEKSIEGFLRDFMFKKDGEIGNERTNIIITDLNSSDETSVILEKLNKDYTNINIRSWNELKEELDKKFKQS